MRVIGAGMAGLLCAAMLRDSCHCVCEAQHELPNNHSAVLRFRSSVVGDVLNVRFKHVNAIKCVEPWKNPVADAMAYSRKTTKRLELRSVATARGEVMERYIAPPNLIQLMYNACMCPVLFSTKVDIDTIKGWMGQAPIISTLPMPLLMGMLHYPYDLQYFESTPGTNINIEVPHADAYFSLYVPDPTFPAYRISLTGSLLTVECAGELSETEARNTLREAMEKVHVYKTTNLEEAKVSHPTYNKILPIDERARRHFIMWATQHYNIYSLGRFATWRPGLLLDDVVNDVRVIQKIIQEGDYDHRK